MLWKTKNRYLWLGLYDWRWLPKNINPEPQGYTRILWWGCFWLQWIARDYPTKPEGTPTFIYAEGKNADEMKAATDKLEPALLTIGEAAKQLGRSRPTIFRYVQENLLEATEVNGRIMIPKAEIEQKLLIRKEKKT